MTAGNAWNHVSNGSGKPPNNSAMAPHPAEKPLPHSLETKLAPSYDAPPTERMTSGHPQKGAGAISQAV